jgi:GrpB-like predicted nucleotidyltransferase (UPF0157 family)
MLGSWELLYHYPKVTEAQLNDGCANACKHNVNLLVDYDARWQLLLLDEQRRIAAALGDLAKGIEHYGSTAVAGMRAKPILDIMVGVDPLEDWEKCRLALETLGYDYAEKGLSKKGDRYLRSLLVNGAMAVVRQAQRRPDKHPLVAKLLGRMSAKQVAIAIANKTARIAWALMVHGGVYEAGHRAPQYRAQACAAAE